jgi:hypothetical protein
MGIARLNSSSEPEGNSMRSNAVKLAVATLLAMSAPDPANLRFVTLDVHLRPEPRRNNLLRLLSARNEDAARTLPPDAASPSVHLGLPQCWH